MRRVNFETAGGVGARQSGERKLPVVVELDEIVVLLGGVLWLRIRRIGDVLHQKLPVGLEEGQHLIRQRIDGLIRDQPLRIFAPAEGRRSAESKRATTAHQ